jgi:hypothetical protein
MKTFAEWYSYSGMTIPEEFLPKIEATWHAAVAEKERETCEWTMDGDNAKSQCGGWTTEWGVKYCQFCGKRITVKRGG